MGCSVSKEATAAVSPLHSPAPHKQTNKQYVQEEKQQDAAPITIKPVTETPYSAPILTSNLAHPITSSSEPNTPDPASAEPLAESSSLKPHKHKHRREPSNVPKQNSPALLAVQPPVRASLSNSTPGHTRKLSGYHRHRSQSIADGVPARGASFNQPDSGNDKRDQGMANQMKMRSVTDETDKPVRTRSVAEPVEEDAEQTGEKREKKHREHKDKAEKDKEKEKEHRERKKKEKLIKTLELADLQHLSSTNLEALWKQYDKDKNGTLDRKELKRLAKDCIGRTIAMCENEIKLQQPKLTDNELKAAVEKELKFVLPGAAKENGKKEDVQKEMVRRLIRKLDVNGDGDVTKAELLATWNVFAKELFQMKTAEGPVGCSIM